MTSKTFVPGTVIDSAWLNNVNSATYSQVNVLDFMTEAQRMNAALRLGTLDSGPGLQLAINAAANGRLIWPAGYVFASAQELIVRSAQVWQGGGKGQMLTPFSTNNTPITELRTLGSGAAYKTVKTRVKYRGSADDPQDDPISALINIQHQGVEIRDMTIRCGYDPVTIKTTPNYLGDDWDVGIFVGCRLHAKINSVAIIGCWRVASLYCDVTRGTALPELYGWDGIQHSNDGNQFGGDGCTLSELITWGGKWGVLIKGADPKPGLNSYGYDYTKTLVATVVTNPIAGDTLTFGEVTFTFVDSASSSLQIEIGDTTTSTAANIAPVCDALFGSTQDYTIFRSAIYSADGNLVRTFLRDEGTTTYANTFTASTSSGGRITLSGATPNTIADPAPYYDQLLGAAVRDQRGSYGFSDFTIRDSQILSSESPTKYARDVMRSDKNWIIDTAGGAFYIDGLAGNGSRALQGHRYFNVRFDGSYDAFNVRLGRTNQDAFIGCHWDGTSTTGFFRPDGSSVGTDLKQIKYGPLTRDPNKTTRTRFFGRSSTPYTDYCTLTDVGSSNIGDGYGGCDLTGFLTVRRGNITLDKSSQSNGAAVYSAKGGSTGSGRYDFVNPTGVLGGLRYYYGSGNLRIATGGNINCALWEVNTGANFSTYTLTCPAVNGTGIFASDGSMRLTAASGDVDIRAGLAPSNVYFRAGTAVLLSLTGDKTEASIRMPFRPASDNAFTLGIPTYRWSVVYSGTSAINTSDEREKEDIQDIDDAVLRAVRKIPFKQFKFKDAVAKKGDDARWHFGVLAQQVKTAFESENLDPFAYGVLCYDEWDEQPEQLDPESGEIIHEYRPAGNRYGVRYEELLCLRLAALEAQ